MKTIKGDLIKLAKEGVFDVIVHGCNCFNTMGHGIAAQVKRELHEAYVVDQHTQRGYKGKLGTFSVAKIILEGHVLYVVNAYTQFCLGVKIIVREASWECGHKEYRVTLDKPNKAYKNWACGYGDDDCGWDQGVAP